ncbi:complement receptor type 2-like [Carettochelys insculpta]|uniref:complement receptor type 2-like n=1 Tax=Carettochelys insculpta TaxID=44489 RepID=UPI003EC034E1
MKHPVNTTASQAGDTICTFSVSEVLCLAPQLQNGRQVGGYDPVHRPRERVRLECDPGYTLNGSREIECQDDATWDPPVPVCVEDTRRQPEQSRRMKHPVNTTASQAGDTICTFSVSEVLCLAPQLQNGRQVGGYDPVHRPRERVRLECDPGYTLNGSREIECQDDATWDPPVPVCVEEVLCLAPQLQNGREVGGYSPVHRRRERVRLECDPGYSLNGSREIECQDDATWDPPVPVCVEDTRRQPEQSRRMKHPVNTTASQAGDTICTFSVSEVLCLAPQLQNGRQVGGYDPVHRPRERVRLECDPGYTLNGSREIECQDDATWDPPVPVCVEEVLCLAPQLQNGREVGGYSPVHRRRERVRLECDPGYSLNGSREIECQDDATWDPPVPVCVEDTRRQPEQSRRMKHPVNTTASQAGDTICTFSVSEVLCLAPQLQNGRQVGGYDPVHRPRERVRLECDPGYTLNGSREIECQDDATWDPPVPVCVEDTRRQPEQSRRMKHPVNTTASQAGDTICTFSVSEVLCLAPQLQNGRQVGGYDPVHRPRERVRLECDPGYTLNGSREIECQDDATWDPPVPVCVEEVLCLAPQLQNGREVGGYSPVHRRRERVRLECDPGYSLNGSREIECQDDATWDPPVPVCVEDTRRQPEQSRRMKHPVNTTASQAGDTICTFSVSEVLCLAPQLQNGRQVGGYDPVHRPRERVRLECDPGYTLNGSREIECQDDATWDPPVPVCVEELRCPSPPAIANGKPRSQAGTVFTSGMSVTYSCEPGYSLSGQASLNCTASGTWSSPIPRCEEVLCLAPQLQNGREVGGYSPVHRRRERVRLECDPGYSLNGSREIECQDDATWDPPVPVCVEELRCPSPPAIANGKPRSQAGTVFTSGMSVTYSCEPGYSLTGQASLNCMASGTWSSPIPRCEGVLSSVT